MKDLQQWAAVQELYKKKVPIAQIAKQLEMSRNTVKRLIRQKEEPRYQRNEYPSKIEQYSEIISEWRTSPRYDFNGTRIYNELKKLGYTGTINPIYRFLKKIDEKTIDISPKATMRIETPIGDQAQFDWSPYEVSVNNRRVTVYCFTMILAASRKKAICFSRTSDAEAIYEAIQELFDDLGGITLELLIDNPKALVIDNNAKNEEEIKFNPKALLLAAHLGMELNACNCFWPRTKGKIEKPYQYIENQFIKGNTFAGMEELNSRGKKFIHDWNGMVHGTTKRIPNDFFYREEIKALKPLAGTRFQLHEMEKRMVSNDSYVHIQTNQYSVPVKYVNKKVQFRVIYGFRIELYTLEGDWILTTEVLDGREKTKTVTGHYKEVMPKVSKSIPQIKREFTDTFKNGEEYLTVAGYLFQQPTYHARKILELRDLYQTETLDKILRYGIDHGGMDITSIKKYLKENFFEIIVEDKGSEKQKVLQETTELTRDCSYYEPEPGGEIT